MGDLLIYETGQGGDANLLPSGDFEITDGLFTMVYIALFGGNPQLKQLKMANKNLTGGEMTCFLTTYQPNNLTAIQKIL